MGVLYEKKGPSEVIQVGEELPYNLVLPCSIFLFIFMLLSLLQSHVSEQRLP